MRSLFGGRIWDLGLRGADWRKQVAAVTAGSRLGAVLVLAGGTSSKNCVCVLNRRALYDHVRR